MFDKWTLKSLLYELDVIELFEALGHERVPGEVTKKQKGIYAELGIPAPQFINAGNVVLMEIQAITREKISEVFMRENSSLKRKKYGSDFKINIVLQFIEKGIPISKLSRVYGINHTLIRRWKKQYIDHGPESFQKKCRNNYGSNKTSQIIELLMENKHLKEKVYILEIENKHLRNFLSFSFGEPEKGNV